MKNLGNAKAKSISLFALDTDAPRVHLSWRRTDAANKPLPAGFSGKIQFAAKSKGKLTADTLEVIRAVCIELIEWHEKATWANLGITGVVPWNVDVMRFPGREVVDGKLTTIESGGIAMQYHRLDETGVTMPERFDGNLMFEQKTKGIVTVNEGQQEVITDTESVSFIMTRVMYLVGLMDVLATKIDKGEE